MSQGQDAKLFQRGKIQVRNALFDALTSLLISRFAIPQEFRAELLAAESKDKKFTKRKTVLKKIVANITMGNDSWCHSSIPCLHPGDTHLSSFPALVSPLFTDVVQCLGTPLLEIKKSCVDSAWGSVTPN
jgi:AP-2 complex subunit beta-1